jgi:methyl-accepting chemotaxis protein
MVKSLEEMNRGEGDLTHKIAIESDDEVGKLALLFNQFIDNLRLLILAVKEQNHVVRHQRDDSVKHSCSNVAQDQASIEETSLHGRDKGTIDSVQKMPNISKESRRNPNSMNI